MGRLFRYLSHASLLLALLFLLAWPITFFRGARITVGPWSARPVPNPFAGVGPSGSSSYLNGKLEFSLVLSRGSLIFGRQTDLYNGTPVTVPPPSVGFALQSALVPPEALFTISTLAFRPRSFLGFAFMPHEGFTDMTGLSVWEHDWGYAVIPFYALILLFALLPATRFYLDRRRRKRTAGLLCPTCNYDLRAHQPGQKCPECGTPIASRNPVSSNAPAAPLPNP